MCRDVAAWVGVRGGLCCRGPTVVSSVSGGVDLVGHATARVIGVVDHGVVVLIDDRRQPVAGVVRIGGCSAVEVGDGGEQVVGVGVADGAAAGQGEAGEVGSVVGGGERPACAA